ncbi:MAG: glycosyltransferase family 9 protein [Clostridium sp.]|nr:glycosyltransferase family 9 protein [Clostridium sp.]
MNKPVRHILVIRFRRVGDSVLAMALCSSLRRTFPEAQIDFVVNKGIHTLYENHPDVDRLITFDDRENHHLPTYINKVWHTMRNTRYDIIIDMRTTVRTLLFCLFSLRTPFRIGSKKGYGAGLLTHRVDNHSDDTTDMVKQNLMLMQPLATLAPLQLTEEFRLYVSDRQRADFRAYMERQGIDFGRPVLMATVTARLVYKVWEKEKMKEILRRIIRRYDAQIIFNFAGKEREMAELYKQELDNDPHIFMNVEANSLPDLCALLVNCNFFFGNEGGPRHIAQALDIPSYAIFPPNIWKSVWLPGDGTRYAGISPDDFMSYREQQARKMSYTERFNLIPMEEVWNGVKGLLDQLPEFAIHVE